MDPLTQPLHLGQFRHALRTAFSPVRKPIKVVPSALWGPRNSVAIPQSANWRRNYLVIDVELHHPRHHGFDIWLTWWQRMRPKRFRVLPSRFCTDEFWRWRARAVRRRVAP